jgi:thiaminase
MQFLIVKNNHLIVENADEVDKNQKITHFNEVYQKFIDNFASSKYKREAEKLYLNINHKNVTKS